MASRHHTVRPVTTEAWNTTGLHVHRKRIAHMTFFWGHNTQVLFPGWPGSSTGMYVLALVFVFSLAVIVEWLSHYNIVKPGASRVAAGLFKTGLHGVRVGLAYMVVLAVMSFNGGIFIAAVVGHAVGYLLFGSRVVFNKSGRSDSDSHKDSDLLPPK
ncbi:Copper transporter 1 [Citrus sinensis]|nr:Copper transporter 1 [Citrus sinensis]